MVDNFKATGLFRMVEHPASESERPARHRVDPAKPHQLLAADLLKSVPASARRTRRAR